jgi:hypothetical protein
MDRSERRPDSLQPHNPFRNAQMPHFLTVTDISELIYASTLIICLSIVADTVAPQFRISSIRNVKTHASAELLTVR